MIREAEKLKRERPNEIRERAWCMAVGPGCHSFWRIGFQNRWGRRAAENDHTVVPGYDEISQQIAWEFPEFDRDDGTERLFDFLFAPYERMPSRSELYQKAIEQVELELLTSGQYSEQLTPFPDEDF